MKEINAYRLRKCSDINMEHPYYEVLDQDENIVMDISRTDEGKISVLFYGSVSEKFMSLNLLEEILLEAKDRLTESE